MTTRFVISITAALACTAFVMACGSSGTAPSKACVEAARVYAEAVDQDSHAPDNEKAKDMAIRKEALAAVEARKDKECNN